ncbi:MULTISPECIES: ROK family transcriptional regulator [Actinomycetes]|uniref:ROK family transcriptional regulator n=2 Tax=Actinomycetes TaxID=1760 RepID=A0ABP6LXB5_9MICC
MTQGPASQPAGAPGSQRALAAANRRRVEAALREHGGTSQAEIARRTGLAPATVSNIVRRLREDGRVETVPGGTRHRPRIRLTPGEGTVVGLDIGHRHISVALADSSGEPLGLCRSVLPAGTSAPRALEIAERLLGQILADQRRGLSAVQRVGLGLPAPVGRPGGRMHSRAILPGWAGLDPAEQAAETFGAPVSVDNDANLAALAEHRWGAGRGAETMAYVKLSDGVGSGLIIDGRLFRGPGGTAGELGHTTIEDHGTVCRCGNRGCLETVASARAILELLEPRLGPGISIAQVVAAASDGDHACLRVLHDTGHHAGRALANLCNLFNPEAIIVGGELAQAGDLLLAPMHEAIRRHAVPPATDQLTVRLSRLRERAGVLGAVALALDEQLRSTGRSFTG